MPLLGNRPHVLNPVVKRPKKNSEEVPAPQFVVPETKEICKSEEELKRKKTLYESKIWTCRVTGRANLTYKEALKSEHENLNRLKKSVQELYRSVILKIVHKNSLPLEPLTHACWAQIHNQFVIGEPVMLKVDSNKPFSAVVLSVDEVAEKPVVIDLSKDETSSPNNSDKENTVNPKRPLLNKDNFSYSVQISSEEPVRVNKVPANYLQRVNRAPSKDHIRMFIRGHAMRYGPSSSGPWVVDTSALRKYCPNMKMANNLVDKDKLRIVSETSEVKFYEKIVCEQSKGIDINAENGVKLSPKSLKAFKSLSALRDDSPRRQSLATSSPKAEAISDVKSKKLKQAVLAFEKSPDAPTPGKKGKTDTPVKSDLPFIAKRLVRGLKGNADANAIKNMVARCVDILTEAQIKLLPENAQKLVIDKKIAILQRKKMQNMTPEEQKAYLRDLRLQKRLLVDENAPYMETGVRVSPLPEPRPLSLPPNMTSLQFSRLLSLTEFIACYQPLLTESALSPGDTLCASKLKQLANDMCRSVSEYSDEEREFSSDDEEESALISTDAGLPKASVRGLRCLSLDRTLQAVCHTPMSASAYRCLTRPMSALLRIVFLNEHFAKQTELGIELSRIPVTPYTAPELLRLLLSYEVTSGVISTNDKAVQRICEILSAKGGLGGLQPLKDAQGAASLVRCLTSADLFGLDTEHRILAVETLIELLLDFDTMDEYMRTCSQKASKTMGERNALAKQKRTVIPPELAEEKAPVAKGRREKKKKEPELDDLASIVKNRRVLAAKAAEEREQREARERERRELEAKIEAEEKALAKAELESAIASTEAKMAFRATLLGTDRRDRRYWRFFCAPNRILIESNWGPEEYQVIGEEELEVGSTAVAPSVVASHPPAHDFPPALASCEPAHRFGYAARSRWFVLDTPEELDALAKSLVDRGVRESVLRKNLVQSGLLESIKELITPLKSETNPEESKEKPADNGDAEKPPDHETLEKITAKVHGNAEAILANVLLRNVYETEIHLRDGGLGGVPNFPTWLASIMALQEKYGLCPNLIGSVPPTPVEPAAPEFSLPSSSSEGTTSQVTNTPLQCVAEALITMGTHVLPRFLNVPKLNKHPLDGQGSGETPIEVDDSGSESGTKPRQQDSSESEKTVAHETDVAIWLEAWSKACRSANTLSRLNVLHACLDTCITWDKSVANVRCRICRRNKDDDRLLLCDGCNSGFHLYCLRPPLHAIPCGDWFCVSCKPPTRSAAAAASSSSTSANNRHQRRNVESDGEEVEEESEVSDQESSRSSSSEEEDEQQGGECRRRLRSLRSSRSGKNAAKKKAKPARSTSPQTKKPATSAVTNDVLCLVCEEEGDAEGEEDGEEGVTNTLVNCSTCPNAFHASCHEPPIRSAGGAGGRRLRNPVAWVCSVCRHNNIRPGQPTLRPSRTASAPRSSRKAAYQRLHKLSTTPKKRPRPISDDVDEDDEDEPETSVEVEEVEEEEEDADEGDNDSSEELRQNAHRDRRKRIDDEEEYTPSSSSRSGDDSSSGSSEENDGDSDATEEQMEEEAAGKHRRSKVAPPPAKRPRTGTMQRQYTCSELISAVWRNRNSWPFQEPVDAKEVPDYYEIVVDPVDLSMIDGWMKSGRYEGESGPKRLAEDFSKLFYNAELYNSADSDVWKAGSQLENYVQSLFKKFSPPVDYNRKKLN